MSLTLRQSDAHDIDAVMAVMARAFDPVFGEAWNRAQVLGTLSLPDVWLMLAEDSAPLGFAFTKRVFDEAELLLLAVDPAARRRGVAAALVERTIAHAATRGVTRLLLEVRAGNPAHALYAHAGFAEIGRRRGYYRGADGSAHDAITLARPIA